MSLAFANTLKAVGAPSGNGFIFHHFSSLPAELRVAIWEHVLPDSEAEGPALFSQGHSRAWTGSRGLLEGTNDQVPIRMTTTCAVLLHVNQESRRTVLQWAERHGYDLFYRMFCRRVERRGPYWVDGSKKWQSAQEDEDRRLPVQGPIFVRSWNPSKDILHVFATYDNIEPIPERWGARYVGGEQLINVQHLAFSIADMDYLLSSRWFLQILAATPDLKSLSFNYDCLHDSGKTFHVRFVHDHGVGDPWLRKDGVSYDRKHRVHCLDCGVMTKHVTITRWEAAPCGPNEEEDWQRRRFEKRLMKAFTNGEYWPPEAEETHDNPDGDLDHWSSEDEELEDEEFEDEESEDEEFEDEEFEDEELEDDSDADADWDPDERKMAVLRQLPPWVWDRDKDTFAFDIRAFQMVERKGYDDVRGGLVENSTAVYMRRLECERRVQKNPMSLPISPTVSGAAVTKTGDGITY